MVHNLPGTPAFLTQQPWLLSNAPGQDNAPGGLAAAGKHRDVHHAVQRIMRYVSGLHIHHSHRYHVSLFLEDPAGVGGALLNSL